MADATQFLAAQAGIASAAVAQPAAIGNQQAMRQAAEDFEAVFLNEMFANMFQGVGASEPFGGGPGELMMRSMLVDEYAKSVAARGGVGIADNVYRELLRFQEAGQ